jgi:nucleoside-diphosphate-sugar epimerase
MWTAPCSAGDRHPAFRVRLVVERLWGRKRPFLLVRTARPIRASFYALTKLQGEQWDRLYARLHGLRFVALRF